VAQALERGLEVKLTERPREGKVRAGGGGGPFGSPEAASGEGGGVFAIPPFQGLLGPLQAAVGGLMGEGQTPDPGLGSRATPAAYLSTSGRPPSPGLSLRGLCGEARGFPATLCRPPPVPGPSGAFSFAKGNFRADGEPASPPDLPCTMGA
jgi:hypothetical protein